MKKCLAILLSALLLFSSAPMVAAIYNDDEFNWGELTCFHDRLIEKEAIASTCITAGNAAYTVCADCHVLVGVKEMLPLAGHTYDDDYDAECNVCGEVREVEPAIAPGDLNEDGRINNYDLGLLRQFVNDWGVTINVEAADVNNDGWVNNRDLGLLMQFVNGWNVELV